MIAERVKSSREAIRYGYYVILGLSLTLAVNNIVSIYDFKTFNPFSFSVYKNWATPQLFLFVVFLATFIRFCHGASLCLVKEISDFRIPVILTDIIAFIVQAIWFFIMAYQLHNLKAFLISYLFLALFDSIWILIKFFGWKDKIKTAKQWFSSDFIIIVTSSIILIFGLSTKFPLKISVIYSLLAVILFVWDYWSNSTFYSGKEVAGRLTIFVAGPYGDALTRDEVANNINNAMGVGKELLLKGHYPFIPHSMFAHWEEDNRFLREQFLASSDFWLKRCDAIFYLGPSPGADRELSLAKSLGKIIFKNLEKIPSVSKG
jgi:hypothetical protein